MSRQVIGPDSYGHLEEMDVVAQIAKQSRREGRWLAVVLISAGLGGMLLLLAVLML